MADLVGDYLFTDKAFVESLTQEDPGLAKRIYQKIKSLCEIFTGTQQSKQLEQVKQTFRDAFRATKNPAQQDGVRYSLKSIVGQSGKNYGIGVYLDSTLLSNLTETERVDMVKEYVKELGGSVFTAYDNNHTAVDVHIVESREKFKNKSGNRVPVTKDLTSYLKSEVKQEAIALVDELVLASSYQGKEPATHPHDWLDNNGANDWDLWKTYIQDKQNTVWEASLRIANSTNGKKILYDIFPIKMVEGAGTSATTTTNNNIAPNTQTVNNKNSLSSEGEMMARDGWRVAGEDVALGQEIATDAAHPRNDSRVAEDLAPTAEDLVAVDEELAPTEEDVAQQKAEDALYGPWRMKDPLDIRVEKLFRMAMREQISEQEYVAQLVKVDSIKIDSGTQAPDAQSPGNTPKASLASSLSANDSIASIATKVKEESKVAENRKKG